jgi:hypothetical protein
MSNPDAIILYVSELKTGIRSLRRIWKRDQEMQVLVIVALQISSIDTARSLMLYAYDILSMPIPAEALKSIIPQMIEKRFEALKLKNDLNAKQKRLWKIVKKLPSDFQPYGQRSRYSIKPYDCSCGCKHYIELSSDLRYDWGVCINPKSPRCGLLTFEHMGCEVFEWQDEA